MGHVTVKARIGATNENLQEVEFMVDTGAFYTILSPAICERLGIAFPLRERMVTADNRTITVEVGTAHIEINGRAAGILVGKMDVPSPLLGVSALEALGFKVNPVDGTLEPPPPKP
ncbi:MAG: retroviral-like aspartic protease family protein, partial [Chloroflexi bacterium]|nr:retroviral-like aspartic protease family protein [Chloroflexota bacterium]